MLKRFFFLVFVLLFAVNTYSSVIHLADPTIYFDGETFYLTGTGDTSNGFKMYSSPDLIHWTSCGNATGTRALYKDDTFGSSDFWAPQIFYYDGSYYMAYVAEEQIAIAKSDSPMGPFKQDTPTKLNGTTGQIDPFVFFDDDGKKYIYYVRFIDGNSLYVGELADDFMSIKDETVTHCISAEKNTWEWAPSTGSQVVEGPTVIKDGGYYFLIYSANGYTNINYSVGYAYSTSPTGPWTKIGHPFLSRYNTGINGTGHGDLFQDKDGNWFYVFHAHESNSAVGSRRTLLVPITLTDDPTNKFIPQIDRMIILDDNAADSATLPDAAVRFEEDGIKYTITDETAHRVEVSCKDIVNFGGYEGSITVPESVSHDGIDYSVVSIGIGAFCNTPDLEKVYLPSSLRIIDIGAFDNSGVWLVDIPSSISSIGYHAFYDANTLLDVFINKTSPPTIESDTFSSITCADGKLWVPEGSGEEYKSKDEWSAFQRISDIENGSPLYDFYFDGLYFAVISEDEATCGVAAKTDEYATYTEPHIVVPQYATYEDKDYTVKEISRMAFRDSRLVESFEIPEGIETLGAYAFCGILGLESITLPSTVTDVSSFCFRDCGKLKSVTCLAQVPPTVAASNAFTTNTYEGELYVPYGRADDYAATSVWSRFSSIIELDPSAIEIVTISPTKEDNAIYNLSGMKVGNDYKGIVIQNKKKYVK